MNFENIIVDKIGSIGKLTINRPDVRNALNRQTLREIENAIEELGNDPAIRVIVITGSGDRAFCAGADVLEMKDASPLDTVEDCQLGKRVFARIEALGKPVIAQVNGYALGGGCELAMACDIRIASDKARFGQPEINLGLIPGYAGTQRLPRLVGKAKAKELIFTGDLIYANEAKELGLVNKVVPPDQLESTVMELATKLASKAPVALKLAKTSIDKGMETSLDVGSAYETDGFALCFTTYDHKEGINAFLEKRKAEFKGY